MPDVLEDPAQGGDEAGVLVGDDQPDTVQATLLERAEELAPEHLVFGVADVQARDLEVGGLPDLRRSGRPGQGSRITGKNEPCRIFGICS